MGVKMISNLSLLMKLKTSVFLFIDRNLNCLCWNLWSQLYVNNVFVVELSFYMIFHINLIPSDFENRTSPKSCFLSVLVVGFYFFIWTICRIWFFQGSWLDRSTDRSHVT